MSNNTLSVIIPVYNMGVYLEKCIDSIIAQTYKPLELILVDDGSTDSSSEICDRYSTYESIKVIHKPNGGLISARKTGLTMASCEYVGFVDADDWIEPDMYECLMDEVNVYSADVVSCGYWLDFDGTRSAVPGTDKKKVIRSIKERKDFYRGILATDFDWMNNRNITPSVCNKVIRKSILEEVYSKIDDKISWDEDTVTVLSSVLDSECIVLIPEILYHYTQNITSMSHKTNRTVLQNYVYTFDELYRISKAHDGILDDQIPFFSLTAIRTALEVGFGVQSGKQYLFPFDKIKQGSNVIIYGAGRVGKNYYNELSTLDYTSELYITDSNPDNWIDGVISPDEAFSKSFDVVLIAVENEITAESIKGALTERGIPEAKVFWQRPVVLKDTYSFTVKQDK